MEKSENALTLGTERFKAWCCNISLRLDKIICQRQQRHYAPHQSLQSTTHKKRSFWEGMGRKKGWRMTAQYVAKYRRFFMSSLQMAFVCKRKCNILVHGLVFLSVNTLGHKMRLEGHKGTIFSFINAEK